MNNREPQLCSEAGNAWPARVPLHLRPHLRVRSAAADFLVLCDRFGAFPTLQEVRHGLGWDYPRFAPATPSMDGLPPTLIEIRSAGTGERYRPSSTRFRARSSPHTLRMDEPGAGEIAQPP